MARLVFSILFLVGCASASKTQSMRYDCVSMTPHGVFARYTGNYACYEEAIRDAETVNKRLIDKHLVPDDSFVWCEGVP